MILEDSTGLVFAIVLSVLALFIVVYFCLKRCYPNLSLLNGAFGIPTERTLLFGRPLINANERILRTSLETERQRTLSSTANTPSTVDSTNWTTLTTLAWLQQQRIESNAASTNLHNSENSDTENANAPNANINKKAHFENNISEFPSVPSHNVGTNVGTSDTSPPTK